MEWFWKSMEAKQCVSERTVSNKSCRAPKLSGRGSGQIRSGDSTRGLAAIPSAWGRSADVVPWPIGLKIGKVVYLLMALSILQEIPGWPRFNPSHAKPNVWECRESNPGRCVRSKNTSVCGPLPKFCLVF